jgi:hypothetical protein
MQEFIGRERAVSEGPVSWPNGPLNGLSGETLGATSTARSDLLHQPPICCLGSKSRKAYRADPGDDAGARSRPCASPRRCHLASARGTGWV